jgi:chromosome segregation ATPase
MLGSTPLEMDDDLMYANIKEAQHLHSQQPNDNMMAQSVYYDVSQYQTQLDNNEKKIDELIKQLSVKDTQLTMVLEELKQKKSSEEKGESLEENHIENERLKEQVELLNEQIRSKSKQNQELSNCLMRQTQLSDNLSELLKKSESKNTELESNQVKNSGKIADMRSDLGTQSLILILFSP